MKRLSLLLAFLSACAPQEDAPTYHQHVAPLLDRYCGGCHQAGGIAPLTLQSYADVVRSAAPSRRAIAAGTMPPWPPSEAGAPLRFSRALAPEHRALLLRWLDGGTPEGDAAAPPRLLPPPPDSVTPPRADLVLDPGQDYQPQRVRADDYHCFVFDPKLTQPAFVQAVAVQPGNAALVHHVIAFAMDPKDSDAIRQLDKDGRGYSCFGGPGNGTTSRALPLYGWAPGAVPLRLPADAGMRVQAGALVVVQVHYNTLSNSTAPDRTRTLLELRAEAPARELRGLGMAYPKGLRIAAGDPAARQDITVPVSLALSRVGLPQQDLLLYGNQPHMHLLGRRIVTSINDQPLLEVPRWDFHWQQFYLFRDPVRLRPADQLTLSCEWDNSAANQPVIDGQRQPPRDVVWGEGSLDEMCVSYLLVGPAL